MSAERISSQGPVLIFEDVHGRRAVDIYSEEGFNLLSDLWVRSGWQQGVFFRLSWMGIPIIQIAEDLVMVQEVIHRVKPDIIVETGTAHGGTAVFYASMLELLGRGRVISIDADVRSYTRRTLCAHRMRRRITLLEGSSTSPGIAAKVRSHIRPAHRVLVALDSDHSYEHVRAELDLYSPLVTSGSYIIVFDGIMARVADAPNGRAEWVTDNPARAVRDFLHSHPEFEADDRFNRVGASYAPGGFLRRRVS